MSIGVGYQEQASNRLSVLLKKLKGAEQKEEKVSPGRDHVRIRETNEIEPVKKL